MGPELAEAAQETFAKYNEEEENMTSDTTWEGSNDTLGRNMTLKVWLELIKGEF